MKNDCEPDLLASHAEGGAADGLDLLSVVAAAEGYLFVENAPLPLVVIDPEGRIVIVNSAAGRLLGYDVGALTGESFVRIFADEDKAETLWADLLETGHTRECVLRLRRRDGSAIRARTAALVTVDDDERPRWVIVRATPV